MKFSLFLFLFVFSIYTQGVLVAETPKSAQEILEEDNRKMEELGIQTAKLYQLPDGVDLLDITEDVLKSPIVKDTRKQAIQEQGRRIVLFTYPSDGLKVKGLISFIPDADDQRTLVFLRGGNRTFGMLNPGLDLLNIQGYTVIATTYRGGVSEGIDEFGGEDVNDVKNLVDFIPELGNKLGLALENENMFMIGSSRGGMQMFLALSRFPDLQSHFKKIISLSGLLDLRETIASRQDMKQMFINDFGFQEGVNEEEWIDRRDPFLAIEKIRQDLPILIIQGTEDIRTSLQGAKTMVNRLETNGNAVTYMEVEGADHCLVNYKDKLLLILDWLD